VLATRVNDFLALDQFILSALFWNIYRTGFCSSGECKKQGKQVYQFLDILLILLVPFFHGLMHFTVAVKYTLV